MTDSPHQIKKPKDEDRMQMSQEKHQNPETNLTEVDSTTRRLFIGCEVNPEWIEKISQVVKKLKAQFIDREIEALWSRPENLHLTLIFLGNITGQIVEINEILAQAARELPAFDLRTQGLGCFPEERSARVIFARVARSQAILDLQSQLEDRLITTGIHAREDREYIPHITLVKLRNPKAVRSIIDPWLRRDFGRLTVSKITLFQSVKSGNYSRYLSLGAHSLVDEPGL